MADAVGGGAADQNLPAVEETSSEPLLRFECPFVDSVGCFVHLMHSYLGLTRYRSRSSLPPNIYPASHMI